MQDFRDSAGLTNNVSNFQANETVLSQGDPANNVVLIGVTEWLKQIAGVGAFGRKEIDPMLSTRRGFGERALLVLVSILIMLVIAQVFMSFPG